MRRVHGAHPGSFLDYPFLACEADGAVIGYAYAHRVREREAYDWDAELSSTSTGCLPAEEWESPFIWPFWIC